MASERKVRLKTLMMVLALVVCANIGDLTMKRGMMEIGAVDLSACWTGTRVSADADQRQDLDRDRFSPRFHGQLHDGSQLGGL